MRRLVKPCAGLVSLRNLCLVGTLALMSAIVSLVWAADDLKSVLADAQTLMRDQNYAEASQKFRVVISNSEATSDQVAESLRALDNCRMQLGIVSSLDSDLRDAIAAHPSDYRVYDLAANQLRDTQHWGVVADQQFSRGHDRGLARHGVTIDVTDRDRLQVLQWRKTALDLARQREPEVEASAMARMHLDMAAALQLGRGDGFEWRLQGLTDLTQQADYLDLDSTQGTPSRAAPVGADDNPILYHLPASWEAAQSDGERLRWSWRQAEESEEMRDEAKFYWGEFLNQQFSVATLQQDAWLFRKPSQEQSETNEGVAAIHTLKESETIAKLASGIKRFTLEDEFNPIRCFQEIATHKSNFGERSSWQLVQIWLNRRQYPRAAEQLAEHIQRFGDDSQHSKQDLLDSIQLPRMSIDPTASQLAGQNAKLSLLFRNTRDIAFTAHKVDIERILSDTKKYYRNFNPQQPNTKFGELANESPPNLSSPGSLFDQDKIDQYLLEQTAQWNQSVESRSNHWDRRLEVETPLTTAGLYLIEAEPSAAATAASQKVRCLIWIEDMAVVQKPLPDDKWLLSVSEAGTGRPIPGVNLELFGYGFDYTSNGNRPKLMLHNFAARSDGEGLAQLEIKANMQWFCVARTASGRLALLGFQNSWQRGGGTNSYAELKAYGVSDRPLYRPGETVKAKFWLGYPTYGDVPALRAANRDIAVTMLDPQGLKLTEKHLRTDDFGGCEFEFELTDSAALGRYNFQVNMLDAAAQQPPPVRPFRPGRKPAPQAEPQVASNLWANVSLAIRVEEFRKPEFEVNILAPEKPVALGETIKARIEAKYYFGAPVTNAEVRVKVERTTFRESHYPDTPYDWLYRPGYWWFAQDYVWYPGWKEWHGCLDPVDSWRPRWGFEPPELVLEKELQLDSTGLATLEIDTSLAKQLYGDEDHKYSITVEVRDASRRSITAQGSVIAAQEPFKIYAWVDRGFYSAGDRISAHFQARQLDGTPVIGRGQADLLRIRYDEQQKPQEQAVASFEVQTDDAGNITQLMSAERAGQYRVRLRLTDAAGHEVEGAYIFTVRGAATSGDDFRYNALELTPDKQHYAPGEVVKLQVAANYEGARVAVFIKPANGSYQPPQWLVLDGKSSIIEIPVNADDQPNFFVEAFTVYNGQYYEEVREIAVPPAQRLLNVEVGMDKAEYLPGEEARVQVKVTDPDGKPIVGSCVIAAYDRALDALAGDVLPPDIREFFWKWQRYHAPQHLTNLEVTQYPIDVQGQPSLTPLGIFGGSVADDFDSYADGVPKTASQAPGSPFGMARRGGVMEGAAVGGGGAMAMADGINFLGVQEMAKSALAASPVAAQPGQAEPTVRKDFADSALWLSSLTTDDHGMAETTFKMPENLTSWKLRTWSVGSETRVGSDSAEAVTRKPLLVRLQTPRFLVERDEVIISAIVHNDLTGKRSVKVALEIDGQTQLDLMASSDREQTVDIEAHQQARVDWRCRASAAGTATLRAIAITSDASDAMQLDIPVMTNGMLKTDSLAGTVRDGQDSNQATLKIPSERRVEQSELVVRMSPSLAASMIDALPYLADYPYGCTEQTLNRFLPSVVTQKVLRDMQIDLASLKAKRNNLNAQELGDAAQRRARWKRFDRTAVFDDELVAEMVTSGVQRLSEMQNGDGGWGWFSGAREVSGAHTTATVVRGLLIAQQNQVPIVPDVLQRGLAWLEQYQQTELIKLQNADGKIEPFKDHCDNIDALVFHVLTLAERNNSAMRQLLYDQREHLSVYGKAVLAWAIHQLGDSAQTNMLRRNIEQFLVQDAENETAYLRGDSGWWYWYGSDIEANAIYLKLLAAVEPKGLTAPRVVKYLLNNRKHATYWDSTRDTALVVEAFADYIRGSGELTQSMKVEVFLSGKRLGTVDFTPKNLFDVNNSIEIHGAALAAGEQQLEIRRSGPGNLYWNAYATHFTLEEEIAPAGLEVKIERRYYHLQPTAKAQQLPGAGAEIVDTQMSGYTRTRLEDLQSLPSGELVEVELLVESKNDYEYLLIEDPKAAGLESIETQSGYFYSAGLSIYRELRDRHVGLCIRWLPKGNYSIRYQFRSEAPGTFTALPSVVQGMYAPELRGNSSDFDLQIVD